MKDSELKQLVTLYVGGEISPSQHAELSAELTKSRQARELFREMVDLEFGLATWASETANAKLTSPPETGPPIFIPSRKPIPNAFIVLAASLLLVASIAWGFLQFNNREFNKRDDKIVVVNDNVIPRSSLTETFGTIRETECNWSDSTVDPATGKFGAGRFKLDSGIAQLKFDSGTQLTIEGPCDVNVDSFSSAKLLDGNVVVNVSELSDGFLLATPDAEIIDQGTEYGVWMDETATEVHVFDGSVVWQPHDQDEASAATISAGEASLFTRADPMQPKRIPFGKRQFVRAMETRVQKNADGKLIAFDGFENLAGKIRRGRSGFGWSGGWNPPGRRRNVGTIVDAPSDKVFGLSRNGQRVLKLAKGTVIQRQLAKPLFVEGRSNVYVSCLLHRRAESDARDSYFQLAITSGEASRYARRTKRGFGFGLSSNSSPYVKNGGAINDVGIQLPREVLFLVARFSVNAGGSAQVRLRVYQKEESTSQSEPETWTASSLWVPSNVELTHISLSTGSNGHWEIDHLRIGESWRAVTSEE